MLQIINCFKGSWAKKGKIKEEQNEKQRQRKEK